MLYYWVLLGAGRVQHQSSYRGANCTNVYKHGTLHQATAMLSDIRREKGDSGSGLRRNSAFSGEDIIPLLPHEQAHAVLRNLPDGVHLILRKDGIAPSLGSLYRVSWVVVPQ